MSRTSTRLRVYEALSASEGFFVSGERLSGALGISRTAIWKAVAALRDSGCVLESVPGRGYRLVGSRADLSREAVERRHRDAVGSIPEAQGATAVFHETIPSTNTEAKGLARRGAAHGTTVVANEQTSGRGRLGRQWFSPKGTGLWMSVVLRPTMMPLVDAPKVTGMAAVAVVEAVRSIVGVSAAVKWPNDVYLSGRKVCGILTEVGAEVDRVSWVVVGVGLNVNVGLTEFPAALAQTATSLLVETGRGWDRALMLGDIAARMVSGCRDLEHGGWPAVRAKLEGLSCVVGRQVVLSAPDGTFTEGRAVGIGGDGELLMEALGGGVLRIFAGDVSVRLPDCAHTPV